MNLHILDVSQFIHAGAVFKRAVIEGELVEEQGGYSIPTINSGGISFIFTAIQATYTPNDYLVWVCDRNPTIKKLMYPEYKANHEYNDDKERQKELAEVILKHCNFDVLSAEGYEADDIIHTIVQNYENEPMFEKIYIHTGDADMFYLVSKKVEILPVTSKNRQITYDNYEYTVKAGEHTPYNSTTINKVMMGCSSDNVPRLSTPIKDKIMRLFNNQGTWPLMGKKNVMRDLFKSLVPEALPQFDLIFPLDVPDIDLDFEKKPNIIYINAWGKTVGNNAYSGVPLVPEEIETMVKSWF